MIAVFTKELRSYFVTPVGWVFMGLFLLAAGFFFVVGNVLPRNTDISSFFRAVRTVFLFAVPLLTMRSFAEERRRGTDYVLFTAPVSTSAVVTAKFAAAFIIFLAVLVVTGVHAWIVGRYGVLPVGETAANYLGFALLGAVYIAVGIFISAVSESQVVAAMGTFFALLLLSVLDTLGGNAPGDPVFGLAFAVIIGATVVGAIHSLVGRVAVTAAGVPFVLLAGVAYGFLRDGGYAGFLGQALLSVSVTQRFENFASGLIRFADLWFYATAVVAFLGATVVVLKRRRWI